MSTAGLSFVGVFDFNTLLSVSFLTLTYKLKLHKQQEIGTLTKSRLPNVNGIFYYTKKKLNKILEDQLLCIQLMKIQFPLHLCSPGPYKTYLPSCFNIFGGFYTDFIFTKGTNCIHSNF